MLKGAGGPGMSLDYTWVALYDMPEKDNSQARRVS